MKTPQVNYRQPNIDRFIEIIFCAYILGFKEMTFKIYNLPLNYQNFIYDWFVNEYQIIFSFDITNPSFCNYYTIPYDFLKDKKYESFFFIINRVKNIKSIEDIELNEASKTLLIHACKKIDIKDIDKIQNIIDLSSVIACMENSKEIKAEHIAEAIQYLPKDQQD